MAHVSLNAVSPLQGTVPCTCPLSSELRQLSARAGAAVPSLLSSTARENTVPGAELFRGRYPGAMGMPGSAIM